MSVPTIETDLAFTALEFEGTYMWESSQVRVWAGPTVPTAGPETYLEVLEVLMGRWGLAVAHWGSKDTDRGGPRKIFLILLFFFCLFSCWYCSFYYFFIIYFYFLNIYIFSIFTCFVLCFFILFFLYFFDCLYVYILFSSLFLMFVCYLFLFYFSFFIFVG